MERAFLGAYWGGRAESAAACAERLSHALHRLGQADPLLRSWTSRSTRGQPAPVQGEGDLDFLTRLLLEGEHRRDDGGEAIADLGFVAGLSNGVRAASVGLQVVAGGTRLVNSFVLNLPRADKARACTRPPRRGRCWMP